MNNDKTPNVSPPPEPIQPALPAPMLEVPTSPSIDNGDGVWVPKAAYDDYKKEIEKQRTDDLKKDKKIRAFYILLAISGFMLSVLYIGMLIWPSQYISKGDCPGQEFLEVAFWLNPIAYFTLLVTGIIGRTMKRAGGKIAILSFIFILVSPIGWFFTGLGILGPILCGV